MTWKWAGPAVAMVALVAALKWSYPVTMPLVVAAFVVAAAWPLQARFERRLSRRLSSLATVACLFLILVAILGAVYLASLEIAHALLARQEQFRSLYETYEDFARSRGLPVPGGEGGYERLVAIGQAVFWRTYDALASLGLILVLISLAVPFAPVVRAKVLAYFGRDGRVEMTDAVATIAGRFRLYLVITTGTSLLTGIASAAWSYSVGLEMALVWGILNFLLNFVPVVGNLIGIVPPVLYAVIQFDGATMPLVVLAGFAIIQVTISNFVYPALQGRGVSMPAIVIVIGLLFWGWLWGLAGALLAVPLTAAFVIAAQHFASTRWIADLATEDQSEAPAPNSRE